MNAPVILVTGANGQVGRALRELAPNFPAYRFVFLSREDLPVHHFGAVENYFQTLRPFFCINCAAYTHVDRAEDEPDLARLVNAESAGVLAAVCNSYHAGFVHLSTDYVFDGRTTVPYREDDAVNPINVYGKTKLEGELLVVKKHPGAIVIRTSWVYAPYGKNFVRTMKRLMGERPSINVVDDQFGSPTYAPDLAACILRIISTPEKTPGIYHFSNEGIISWYEFARAIRDILGSTCQVNPVPSTEYPVIAKRPPFSALSNDKIVSVYQVKLIPWRDSLETCLHRLKNQEG